MTTTTLPQLDADGLAQALAETRGLLLVDYYADDCIWCERLEPVLVAAMERWRTEVRMVKVNARTHPQALPAGGIRGTPTIALFRDGRLVMSKAGMIQRAALDVFLAHWLDPANEGLAGD